MAIVEGKIRCGKCREFKDLENYTPSRQRAGCGTCNVCQYAYKLDHYRRNAPAEAAKQKARRDRNLERHRGVAANWRRANPDKRKGYELKKNYGLSVQQYDDLLKAQGGGCAICGAETNKNGKSLFVDHCHDTGRVRGILCYKCNTGLGSFLDNPELIQKALSYLT